MVKNSLRSSALGSFAPLSDGPPRTRLHGSVSEREVDHNASLLVHRKFAQPLDKFFGKSNRCLWVKFNFDAFPSLLSCSRQEVSLANGACQLSIFFLQNHIFLFHDYVSGKKKGEENTLLTFLAHNRGRFKRNLWKCYRNPMGEWLDQCNRSGFSRCPGGRMIKRKGATTCFTARTTAIVD